MVENLYEDNVFSAMLAAIVWGLAALSAGRLALRPSGRSVRRRAISGLVLLVVALLAVGLRTGLAAWLSNEGGWVVGADMVLVTLPPLVLPALAVAALSVPALWRLARTRPAEASAPPPRDVRVVAGGLRFVLPVQVTAVGALVSLIATLHPPAPPYLPDTALMLVLVAAGGAGLGVRHHRRATRLATPDWTRPSMLGRLVKGTAATAVACLLAAAGLYAAAEASKLPDRTSMNAHGSIDTGGGPPPGAPHGTGGAGDHHGTTSITTLTGDRTAVPDHRFALAAQRKKVRLASGETVDALTFNGELPGPELRARVGELVEVTLTNVDVKSGVTAHWHGIDVPNAEDGVAGVTQDAVRPGGKHVYRFRPNRAGTFWYHAHQQSSVSVGRGLFGTFIVSPAAGTAAAQAAPPAGTVDRTVVAHAWDVTGGADVGGPRDIREDSVGLKTALDDSTGVRREKVAAGTPVRLRLVNADNCPRTFSLTGTPYRVAAIDGNDVNAPTDVTGTQVRVAGGGRYDLTYRQPAGTVQVLITGDANIRGGEGCGEDGDYGGAAAAGKASDGAALLLGPDPSGAPVEPEKSAPILDPSTYGSPAPAPFGPDSRYDRSFAMVFGTRFGFYDGQFGMLWTINNTIYPHTPSLLVSEGDLVKVSFANRSLDDHPMHLHGHRMLVLSREGRPTTGSPWWTDTLNIAPGERYEIAFKADNPGIWMDHCHNLEHARIGMVMHLTYDGVSTPFEAGPATGNLPE